MSEERAIIEGVVAKRFAIWSMVIAGIPGQSQKERLAVDKTIITDDGRLVFVSRPFPKL